LYLIEYTDNQQELRRRNSIEPVSRLHSRNSSQASNIPDEPDFWESESFEPAHVRTRSGKEALCIGVEDHGESYVILEYPSGRTAVRDARSVSRLDKPALLVTEVEKKKNTQKLFSAVQQHSIFDVGRLLDRQADINGQDSIGFSPLLWSIQHNRYDIMSLLLENKADPTLRDNQGASALTWALRVPCSIEIVSTLTSFRSILNQEDELGRTPLITSCLRSYRTFTAILYNAGASVLPVDAVEKSAVDWAEQWNTNYKEDKMYLNLTRRHALETCLTELLPADVVFLIVVFELDRMEAPV